MKFDFRDVEQFKSYVRGFMKYHNLRGVEMLRPYRQRGVIIRACGRGMKHDDGPLNGMELWEGIDSMLRPEDSVTKIS